MNSFTSRMKIEWNTVFFFILPSIRIEHTVEESSEEEEKKVMRQRQWKTHWPKDGWRKRCLRCTRYWNRFSVVVRFCIFVCLLGSVTSLDPLWMRLRFFHARFYRSFRSLFSFARSFINFSADSTLIFFLLLFVAPIFRAYMPQLTARISFGNFVSTEGREDTNSSFRN